MGTNQPDTGATQMSDTATATESTTDDAATATDTVTDTTTTTTSTDTSKDTATDTETEGPDWKALARKHEKRAKDNADAAQELAKIKAENQTPSEKALNEAREAGRAESNAVHLQALAGARLEAALTGIVDDPAEFVDDLNLAKFVTNDGEVDTAAIAATKAKYQKAATAKGPGSADGGARGRDDKPKRSTSLEGAVERAIHPPGH
jgi:ribosomal protein S18